MLRLRINTDGDAFAGWKGPSEVATILRRIAQHVEVGRLDCTVIDSNGNTCGQWDLRFERSQAEDTDA